MSSEWDRIVEIMYKRWLVERVLLHGESTVKCAQHLSADPEDVERDLNEALTVDWQDIINHGGVGGTK